MSSIQPTFASYLPQIEKRVIPTDALTLTTAELFNERVATGLITLTQEETVQFRVTSCNISSYDESRVAVVAAMKTMVQPDPESPEAYRFQLAELIYERHQSCEDPIFDASLVESWPARAGALLPKATLPDDIAVLCEIKVRAFLEKVHPLEADFLDSVKTVLQQDITPENKLRLQSSLALLLNRTSTVSIAYDNSIEALRLFEEQIPSDKYLGYKKALIHFDLGQILFSENRFEEAGIHFEAALAVRVLSYDRAVLVTTPLYVTKTFLLPRSNSGLTRIHIGSCLAHLVEITSRRKDTIKFSQYVAALAPFCAELKAEHTTAKFIPAIIEAYEGYQVFHNALVRARADYQVNVFSKLYDELILVSLEPIKIKYVPESELFEFHCLRAWGQFFYLQLPGERAFDYTKERDSIAIKEHVTAAGSWHLKMTTNPAITRELEKLQLLASLLSEEERWILSTGILPLDKTPLTAGDLIFLERQVYLLKESTLPKEARFQFIEKCLLYVRPENAKYFYDFNLLHITLISFKCTFTRDLPATLAGLSLYIKDKASTKTELLSISLALDLRESLYKRLGDLRSAYADALQAVKLFSGQTDPQLQRIYRTWLKELEDIEKQLKPTINHTLDWHFEGLPPGTGGTSYGGPKMVEDEERETE